jgi:predicted ATPase
MTDIRDKLASKFLPRHRYANFGPILRGIRVTGFRGITASIEFEFPVTAITGLNGAGKSTFGQLLLCGYKRISTSLNSKRFYVKDFFPVSVADPKPFHKDASALFTYETDSPSNPQELTVTRANKEWSGYKRQPERQVAYVGLAFYIPKVERKDLSIYSAKSLELTARVDVDNAREWVSRILGSAYHDVFFQGVKSARKSAELGVAYRYGTQYSENNMGFGEGRVVHTIRLMETLPEKSLVVLEEPETSLHEYAQYELAKYFMDVSFRRGHQIVFSTHSSAMMNALPVQARKLIVRDESGVQVYDRLSSSRIRTALSAGESGHAIVAVEDRFAKLFLTELLRRKDKELLASLEILDFGDARSVENAVLVLRRAGTICVAVRDADQAEKVNEGIFCLPGSEAPEKEVFLSAAGKQKLRQFYDFDLEAAMAADSSLDHHKYAELAEQKTSSPRGIVEIDCIRAFLDSSAETLGDDLVRKIKANT